MSGAQNWSVKGIDPKIREAAREAAARSGMTLGEYLSAALQSQQTPTTTPTTREPLAPRVRTPRLTTAHHDDEDWNLSSAGAPPRSSDPRSITQRLEAIERRTQLAVTGLDRAVSTIDRSVLGLAARVEDAERVSTESADRIAEALDHFRIAGETLSGRLESAEAEVTQSRFALDGAQAEMSSVRERLENQVALAEEVARRAEAATSFLTTELESRDAALSHRLGAFEDTARDALKQTLAHARAAAEDAAREAAEASRDAVTELRRLQEHLAERLTETEHSARRAVESAIAQTKAELLQRAERAEAEARNAKDAIAEEVVRLEGEITTRIAAAEQLRADQSTLIGRIERAEAGAREATAGLRQAAGAAIADLRNAQLSIAARLKQIEDTGGGAASADLASVRAQQSDIADRLAALENGAHGSAVTDALTAFEQRLSAAEQSAGAVTTLDEALARLGQRLAETESTANNAIRTLEETVSALGAKVNTAGAKEETDALRNMLEQRLDTMAQSVTQMVGEVRTEFAGQLGQAMQGVNEGGVEEALADVNRRLAAAERRQAQTIEAISLEIKRMSETVDRRLRTVETRNDDAAASAVREELARMAQTLEHRFDEIERREAAGFDRMGLEVGRLSERLEERVGAVETRSAQAIEQVGEQVARMAERYNQKHEILARDLSERMIDSEERAGARVSEAISSIMQRLSEVEERSAEEIAPVKKAMSNVASRLDAFESKSDDEVATPARRYSDFDDAFGVSEHYVAPMDAAQPLRAGPLPPLTTQPPTPDTAPETPAFDVEAASNFTEFAGDEDIYFAEDEPAAQAEAPSYAPPVDAPAESSFVAHQSDDLVVEDPFLDDDALAPPPPEDDDPFWTPDVLQTVVTGAPVDTMPAAASAADEMTLTVAPKDDAPPGKNDYLNAARKAAQAQVQAKPEKGKAKKEKKNKAAIDDVAPAPTYSLRGSSRIVFWGAAGAIALLVAGGAWYMNQSSGDTADPAQAPDPDATTGPAQAAAPAGAAEAYDPNAPFGTPVQDPFAEGQGVAPADGVPVANAEGQTQQVVAGPLGPRNLSLEQAAQGGDIIAQYELGLQRIAAGRGAEGVTMLRRAADRGLAMAQYRLAKLYERGEGVETDLVQARQWTERAAAAGNRRAMHDLGVYFARGEGAPLDEAAAFRWFRQAAELGVADSQYNLGVLYQQGRGVNASPAEAMFWFLVAARSGDEDAATRAQSLQAQLQPIQVEQARSRAQAFRPRAASAQANGEFGPRAWNAPARPAA
ncbi:MAG: hypothetical protein AB7P07_06375 [Hyphomonadaceae bacterium]